MAGFVISKALETLRVEPSWELPCQCGPVLGWIQGPLNWGFHLEWKHRLVECVDGVIVKSSYHHGFQTNRFRTTVTVLDRELCSFNDISFDSYLPPFNIYFYNEEAQLTSHTFAWPPDNGWKARWYFRTRYPL